MEQAVGVTLDELNVIRRKVVRDCFITVGVEALSSLAKKNRLSKAFGQRDLPSFAAACYDSNLDAPLENACYQLLITSQYLGTATETLYSNYSRELANMASKARTLTKEDCELLEAKVMTDILVNALIDNGIVTVD